MINFNGNIVSVENNSWSTNRGFLFGDAVFETLKIVDGKILFWEDHYFRLMASMRIIRMEIPMHFTLEFLEQQIISLVQSKNIFDSARVRITIYRNEGGYYLPQTNTISYLIEANRLENKIYFVEKPQYEVDLFKDFHVTKQLLSTIKSTNKLINITGSIYAKENGLDTCLLLNEEKNVVEALHGNLFMLMGTQLITPPVSDGCLNGIARKQILNIAKKINNVEVVEHSISPFDLQKADELFITNVIRGIQPISQYRKKTFGSHFSNDLIVRLNALIRLS